MKKAHPSWAEEKFDQEYPFFKLSWLPKKSYRGKSIFDSEFPARLRVRYYPFGKALLSSDRIDETYAQLLKTNFVSLYASTNPSEDFAETYEMYVHLVLQNRQWKMRILKEGKIVREITNPILDKRCEAKKIIWTGY